GSEGPLASGSDGSREACRIQRTHLGHGHPEDGLTLLGLDHLGLGFRLGLADNLDVVGIVAGDDQLGLAVASREQGEDIIEFTHGLVSVGWLPSWSNGFPNGSGTFLSKCAAFACWDLSSIRFANGSHSYSCPWSLPCTLA